MFTDHYPFPFVGAGLARYFEWGSIFVKFHSVPDDEMIRAIVHSSPPPMRPEAEHFQGKILYAISGQYINRDIEIAYGKREQQGDHADVLRCSVEALKGFEKDTERWLKEIHAICPIEIVVRPEEIEATDGTQLSDWHYESLKEIDSLFKKWVNEPMDEARYSQAFFLSLLNGLLVYHRPKEIELLKRFLPDSYAFELLSAGSTDGLEEFLKTDNSESFFEEVCNGVIRYLELPSPDNSIIIKVISLLITNSHFLHYIVYHNVQNNHRILVALLEQKEIALFENLKTVILSADGKHLNRIIQPVYYYIHNALQSQRRWDLMIPLYDLLMDMVSKSPLRLPDLSFYCNSLWVLQNDNTGLPVNKELNEKFLSISLMQAKDNPAVFYNAACLYNEMGDHENAVVCIKRAVEHGMKGQELKGMLSDITTAEVFKVLRDIPAIKSLVKELLENRSSE
jgi:hypothetical protein